MNIATEPFRCPACGKINDPAETYDCQRCEANLESLIHVREAALQQLGRAHHNLLSGSTAMALEHAKRSWSLHHTAQAARIAFVASMINGSLGQAQQWHQREQKLK